jgi:GcrA cell cycle regulator
MRADLAAGVDRNVVIKRAIGAGAKSVAVAEFFGLPRWRVYKIAEPLPPRWTIKQVELLLTMWPDHTAQEIADALGTTRGAVLGKIWRVGLGARKSKNSTSAPGHSRRRALSTPQAA